VVDRDPMSRVSTCRLWLSLAATIGAISLSPAPAAAEPSAAEKAAAEALFQQGTEFMSQKRFSAACEKFEGSQQLDPALGTMLRLADCYDRSGKTASAWALFREAASLAKTRAELDRERIANERAADLEKRLSKLELRVDRKNAAAGVEIQLNGVTIPRATWDTPVPVDPGHQRITASGPDRAPWSITVDVAEGPGLRSIEVPALAPKPHTETPEPATPATQEGSGHANTLRTTGYVAGGLAVVGFAAAGLFAYQAYNTKQQSLEQCRVDDPNACTPAGKDLRDDAKRQANIATLAMLGGGAMLAGSVVLFLSSRSPEPRSPAHEVKASLNWTGSGPGLRLEGTW
jgi:hypothetical protein